jgi:hypothetical protein
MRSSPKTLGELMREAVDERAEPENFSAGYIEAKVRQLREKFHLLREGRLAVAPIEAADAPADLKYRLDRVLAALPAARRRGWLAGARGALQLLVGRSRETSRILVEAARDLLPADPGSWRFVEPAAARGGIGEPGLHVFSTGRTGVPPASVTIEQTGQQSRLAVTIADFPPDEPPPVLLLVPVGPQRGQPVEVDAQISGVLLRRLHYERAMPPGEYLVFLGNPRPE